MAIHLILNRRYATVRCGVCGRVLISRHRHDHRVCGCPQETMVDGGSAYLRCGGRDLARVQILVDPEWPRGAELGLLQDAVALARSLGCRFEPTKDATDHGLALVVQKLRRSVNLARRISREVRSVLVASGDWPPVLAGEAPVAMVRVVDDPWCAANDDHQPGGPR